MLSKRKIRLLVSIVIAALVVATIVRGVKQFQLNKEIQYYRKFFQQEKDGLHEIYNPLDIKQIPEETIDALYEACLSSEAKQKQKIDWSKLAYVNYVTDASYLCNTLIMFNTIRESGSKARLVLLISEELLDPESSANTEQTTALLDRIRELDSSQVIIKTVENIIKPQDFTPWNESLTKLLVFNQTEFERIVYLDNDALLKTDLDELFFIPKYIKFAAPLSYWFLSEEEVESAAKEFSHDVKQSMNLGTFTKKLNDRASKNQMIYNHLPGLPLPLMLDTNNVAQDIISSSSSASPLFDFRLSRKESKTKFATNVMVINPSTELFQRVIEDALPKIVKKKEKYDMDLINEQLFNLKQIIYNQLDVFRKIRKAFVPEVLVLPFGRYGLLTGSIKNKKHYKMIQNDILGYKRLDKKGNESPVKLSTIVSNAKYIHFSDFPIGKPWYYSSLKEFECKVDQKKSTDVKADTLACELWNGVYERYLDARAICT